MRSMGKVAVAVLFLLAASLLFLGGDTASGGGKGKKKKVKLDPEITAVQKALQTARARLKNAIDNEVFGEKGKVEGAVIDQLKIALKNVDAALKAANKAQQIDKGG